MAPKKCFVIMPFSATTERHTEQYWTKFFEYLKEVITGLDYGYEVTRSAAIPGNIVKKIIEKLSEADIVVAVLTDKNANVWYELGTRHAIRPGTILLIEAGQRLPSDIASYGTIYYDDTHAGHDQFRKDMKDALEKHASGEAADSPALDFLAHRPAPGGLAEIAEGFLGIKAPKDLLASSENRLLVFGANKTFFSDDIQEAIRDKNTHFRILLTLDANLSKVRAEAMEREYDVYTKTSHIFSNSFIDTFSEYNNDIRINWRYPFGLYLQLGNYGWLTPLWNEDLRGSAIRGVAIECKFGSKFFDACKRNFDELWASSTDLSAFNGRWRS